MKIILSLLFFLSAAVMMSAQSPLQQGQVKTPGRQINSTTYQQGQGLPGTMVTIKGQGKVKKIGVQKNDGTFSFSIPSQTFYVQNVQKTGYQLVDEDVTRRPQNYSKNLLELVMQKPDVKAQQEAKIQKQKNNELERQNKKLLEEIERLKEQNIITEAERDSALQIINRNEQLKEPLAEEFAQRYSCLDYDQLDEFYRQVSFCIEEGDLCRADSLLHSRGDIVEQVALISRLGDDKAVNKEELANRCYSHYELSALHFRLDSAAYYIELRASIDTANLECLNEAGRFLNEYMANYDKALLYFQRVLRLSLAKYGENADWTATAYNNIGSVWEYKGDYDKALRYYQMAYDIWKEIFTPDHPVIATCYSNIGRIYNYKKEFKKALRNHNRALEKRQQMFGNEHLSTAKTYAEIGGVYLRKMEFEETDKYYDDAIRHLSQALRIHRDTLGLDHPDVARIYNSIAGAYADHGEFTKALDNYENALQIYQNAYLPVHPDIAMVYRNIGDVYAQQGNYDMAIENMAKSLEILQKVFGANTKNPNIDNIQRAISNVKYQHALEQGDLSEFLLENVFTATVTDEDSPAGEQDMMGEYILLEFANWTQDSSTSLYDAIDNSRGKPKYMVVLRDDEIHKYYFEDKTGAQLDVKPISREEKRQIDDAYRKWKKTQK